MAFDERTYQDVALKVRRPKDFIGIDPSLGYPGMAGGTGDSPNKLFIGGLPTYLNDEQIMELLKSFGELKSFNLVKEGTGSTMVSKVTSDALTYGVILIRRDRALLSLNTSTLPLRIWLFKAYITLLWGIDHWLSKELLLVEIP